MSDENRTIDEAEALWRELESRPGEQAALARRALGLWCVAREPLPFSMVARLVDCPDRATRDRLQEATRAFLVEQRASQPDGEAPLAVSSDTLRAFVIGKLGPDAVAAQHGALGAWPTARRGHRRYALLHTMHHRIEAGRWPGVEQLGFDIDYLRAQCREIGPEQALASVTLAREHPRGAESARWAELAGAIDREAERLRRRPLALPSLLYNRMVCGALPLAEISRLLSLPKGNPRLRLEHALQDTRQKMNAGETPTLGHAQEVRGCAVTPDGKRAVSASSDRTLKVWDLETGKELFTLVGHSGPVNACAVASEGQRIVSGSEDGVVLVWDLPATPSEQPVLPRVVFAFYQSTISCVQLGADARTAIFLQTLLGAPDSFVHWKPLDAPVEAPPAQLWLSGEVQSAYATELDSLNQQETELLNRLDVIAMRRNELFALMMPQQAALGAIAAPNLGPGAPAPADPRPQCMALGTALFEAFEANHGSLSPDEVLAIADRVLGAAPGPPEQAPPPGAAGAAEAPQMAPRSEELATGRIDRNAPTLPSTPTRPCALTPDGLQLLVAEGACVIVKQLDPLLNGATSALGGHTDAVTALVITPDGQHLVTGSRDRTLRLWDLLTHECLAVLEGHSDPVAALAITPDGWNVVSAAADALYVWDLDTLACLGVYPGEANFGCVAATQERVVAGDELGNVWMLELSRPAAPGTGTRWGTGRIKKRHALLVGINRYDDPAMEPLPFCVNDVEELGRVLDERDYDVVSVHDARAESFLLPTRDNIRAELSLLRLDPNDLLLVHFSCHGLRIDGKPYLFTKDCLNARVRETGLAVAEVIGWMAATGARRQVLLIDACYAGVDLFGRGPDAPTADLEAVGQALPGEPRDPSAPPRPPSAINDPRETGDAFERSEGLALLTASSAVQRSFDRETRPNSLFTSLVIEGLAGLADGDGKGFVTVDDLKNYVAQRTRALVDDETHKPQTPTAQVVGTGDMILTPVLR